MSDIATRILERSEETLLALCWGQWKRLAGETWGGGEAPGRSMIDPEALLLGSLLLCQREARLRDRLAWWAETGSNWMSVARIRAMLRDFPAGVEEPLAWFASRSPDRRWRALGRGSSAAWSARHGKGAKEVDLTDPAALMLRLRAGFGVGAKADLLSFLLGARTLQGPGFQGTASRIAQMVQFSSSAVRRAAGDMSRAGMISTDGSHPPKYWVDEEAWAHLLLGPSGGQGELPRHNAFPRFAMWGAVVTLLAHCREWAQGGLCDPNNRVPMASLARDLVLLMRLPAGWNRWKLPDVDAVRGEAVLEVLEESMERLAQGIAEIT